MKVTELHEALEGGNGLLEKLDNAKRRRGKSKVRKAMSSTKFCKVVKIISIEVDNPEPLAELACRRAFATALSTQQNVRQRHD